MASLATACDPAVALDPSEALQQRIRSALLTNGVALALAAAVGAAALLVLFLLVRMAMDAVRAYRRATRERLDVLGAPAGKAGSLPAQGADPDDNVYRGEPGPQAPRSEKAAVDASIQRMKDRAAAYNRALTAHLAARGRSSADHLIDERVLSREHDDYRPEKEDARDEDAWT